jgi:Ca2+-binding RTX toxin-like protein
MTDTVVIAEQGDENTGYRFSWGLAIAGGVAATAVTFFLLTLGAGFGLLLVNPMAHSGASTPVFLTGGAIYFFVAQAFGFAVGGHLVGRLLGPLVESHIQEEFRAAAHGFVAWAVTILATLTIVALAGLTAANTGAASAALYGVTTSKTIDTVPTAYLVDVLFRPGASGNESARAEAGRLLEVALVRGEQLAPGDRTRLMALVSAQAGISRDQAAGRIDRMQADVQAKTKHAADIARRAASYASLWIAFSLLFGSVVAMAAAIFARKEDDREAAASG